MPRKLIIGVLVVLIVGGLVATIALVASRLRRGDAPTPSTTPTAGTLNPAQSGGQTIVEANSDDDSDGLSNAQEVLWGTDPRNADSDKDGYRDGEEVANRYNPTIASPGDKLAADFNPGQAVAAPGPATGPPQVEQYFEDGLDLQPVKTNLSTEYKRTTPEGQRTPDTLAAFVDQQPITTKLPTVKASAFTSIPNAGPATMREYLNNIGTLGTISNREQLAQGLGQLYASGDTSTITLMAEQIRYYQSQLLTFKVPTTALNFHRLLVGYTQLLAATFDQIALWNDDAVKATVGIRQLQVIDQEYFPVLQQERTRLESEAAR